MKPTAPAPLTPADPVTPATPQATMGSLLPMMMFMGRGSRRSSRGSSVGGVAYDPYQCAATCAAQQGYCPKPAAAFLQLQEMPLAPQPPKAPLPPLSSLPPLLPPLPPQADGMGFMYPMMMFMGAKRRKAGGIGANPMLGTCIQTCQTQLGCGELPAGD